MAVIYLRHVLQPELEHGGRDDDCPAVLSTAKHGLTVGRLMLNSQHYDSISIAACMLVP